jgi:hypothetical protein
MTKNRPNEIAEQIIVLVNELARLAGSESTPHRAQGPSKKAKPPTASRKGATGALELLFDEGFFNHPKELNAIMERLKQIGHFHKVNAIAMNLLNLTKRRRLNRFRNKESKNWEYVIRK